MRDTDYTVDVVVIGGGAAGMAAAIFAARQGASTAIIEHGQRVGKKLLSTGNGRCNYTNKSLGESCYRGGSPGFAMSVLEQFLPTDAVNFFRELGILPLEQNGYFYPASRQAASVLDVLRMELERQNVSVLVSEEIKRIETIEHQFLVHTKCGCCQSAACILATGGKAAPDTGSDGSGYQYAKDFGHTIVEPVPALVPLLSDDPGLKAMAGARVMAKVSLFLSQNCITEERGEVQFIRDGISGIPVFQLSRHAAYGLRQGQKVTAGIDFAPDFSDEEVFAEICRRCGHALGDRSMAESLTGWFPKNVIPALLKKAGIPAAMNAKSADSAQKRALAKALKDYKIDIRSTMPFQRAQVTAGGVDTGEIFADSMESKLKSGLYFAGEIVDIDGICGGYNLQWAWSSGFVAGTHAAGRGRKS